MKAYVLKGVNDLEYCDTDKPRAKENEVIVEVKAAGICGSDIPRIFETGTYKFPTIVGHEFSGIVSEVGKDCRKELVGKRVGVFPLIPCGECEQCKKKKYELCRRYGYLGSRSNGAFAQYVAVPESNLTEIPENISFEEAAMFEPTNVALHALRQADIENVKYKNAVVFGAGTVGILTAQWLKYFEIENIFVVGTNEHQKEILKRLEILTDDNFCDTHKKDPIKWLEERTNGEGAELVVECAGKIETINEAVQAASPEGSVVLTGNPESDITLKKDIYWKILRNQLKIYGTWNSSFVKFDKDDWKFTVKAINEGKIHPKEQITHKFDFSRLEKGLSIMRNKTEFYNKIMIVKGEF